MRRSPIKARRAQEGVADKGGARRHQWKEVIQWQPLLR